MGCSVEMNNWDERSPIECCESSCMPIAGSKKPGSSGSSSTAKLCAKQEPVSHLLPERFDHLIRLTSSIATYPGVLGEYIQTSMMSLAEAANLKV